MARRRRKIITSPALIGGPFTDGYLPDCLTDKGSLIDSPIGVPAMLATRDPAGVIFAEGAEFGDACRAMLMDDAEFFILVRAANVSRLVRAGQELEREVLIDPIPHRENPEGLYGRLWVGKRISYSEGEGPPERGVQNIAPHAESL